MKVIGTVHTYACVCLNISYALPSSAVTLALMLEHHESGQ